MQELAAEVEALQVTPSTPRRSERKRIFIEPPPTPPAKRKSKPTILTADKLRKFYMNKTSAKFARHALETIYEDPQSGKSGSSLLIGASKIKRAISMDLGTTKLKKMCRKNKIKRLGMKGAKFKKISDDEFRKRMMMIDAIMGAEAAAVAQIGVPTSCSFTNNNEMTVTPENQMVTDDDASNL